MAVTASCPTVLIINRVKDMLVRKMLIADYEAVYALWMACPGMELNNLDDSKEGIEKFLKRNADTCFVAETQGEIAGVILVGNDGRRGYIYHAAVLPKYRKQGIASLLLDAAMAELEKAGINRCALMVFKGNELGNAFWAKKGFEPREDILYRYKSFVPMERIDT